MDKAIKEKIELFEIMEVSTLGPQEIEFVNDLRKFLKANQTLIVRNALRPEHDTTLFASLALIMEDEMLSVFDVRSKLNLDNAESND